MADNQLAQVTAGKTGFVSQINQYFSALTVNFLPRSIAGTVANLAGTIGETTRRWAAIYVQDGDFSGDVTIGGNLNINGAFIGGNPVTTILSVGSGAFELPADVHSCIIQCYGGGGGGSGAFSTATGGGGGAFTQVELGFLSGGQTINWTAGAGGNGINSGDAYDGGDSYASFGGEQVCLASGGDGGHRDAVAIGGVSRIRQDGENANYIMTRGIGSNGGNTSGLPTMAGYGSVLSSPNGAGASVKGNGGLTGDNHHRGGGGGYLDGGNGSVSLGGNGGAGAVVITYFKGD